MAINYNLAAIQGTYQITDSAPGYVTETRQVTINSGAYTRGDFSLEPSAATSSFSGTVTGASGVRVPYSPSAQGVGVGPVIAGAAGGVDVTAGWEEGD